MIDVDISWMSLAAQKTFLAAVEGFAEAVRTGETNHYDTALLAMRKAGQIEVAAREGIGDSPHDPSI